MSTELQKFFTEYPLITVEMRNRLRENGVLDVVTYHTVGQTAEKCTDKLATLAGLAVGQAGSTVPPNPLHHVPAAHLMCIWKALN